MNDTEDDLDLDKLGVDNNSDSEVEENNSDDEKVDNKKHNKLFMDLLKI